MNEATVRRLVALNKTFYATVAEPFATSRAQPQPGFERLRQYLAAGSRVLDVGCGEGRFGRFLRDRGLTFEYLGVDFSVAVLAAGELAGRVVQRDLSRPGCLDDLGLFNLIACLSTLQHIPGRENRARLLTEMATCLAPGGHVALANWQFTSSARQRRKIRPWSEVNISESDVEAGDYLLSWDRGARALRYVALVDEGETLWLARSAKLRVVDQFRDDGREGNLNLYTVLAS